MNSDLKNAVEIKNLFISRVLHEGGFAVDATVGNGYDSLILSDAVGNSGRLLGFDVQEAAIANTRELLDSKAKHSNYKLIRACHTRLDEFIREPVDVFVYNLGYLPGGDKAKTTHAETTIQSIRMATSLLKSRGCILVVCYPGHASGSSEEEAVHEFAKCLDQKSWSVLRSNFINQINEPPVLYFIQKR